MTIISGVSENIVIDFDVDEYLDYKIDYQFFLDNDSVISVTYLPTTGITIDGVSWDASSSIFWLRATQDGSVVARMTSLGGRIKDTTLNIKIRVH